MKRLQKTSSNLETITEVAQKVREEIVSKYGDLLYGKCIEASERIQQLLLEKSIQAKTVEGWCIYGEDANVSSRPYDEHTWVEVGNIYIDVTADQFKAFVDEYIPPIIVGDKPDYMVYDEPTYLLDEE